MKSLKFFFFLGINPIYRDVVLVLLAGFLASLAFVTIGYMIASQL